MTTNGSTTTAFYGHQRLATLTNSAYTWQFHDRLGSVGNSHIIALKYLPYEDKPGYTVILSYDQLGLQAEVHYLEEAPLFNDTLIFDRIIFSEPSVDTLYLEFFPMAHEAMM